MSDLRFTMKQRIPFFLMMAIGISPALAAAPMAKTQAPGFYRLMVGDFEVTALNDGYWLAGSHLSFPGIGQVRPASQGYEWLPVNYAAEIL